jgi:hypothetical protein
MKPPARSDHARRGSQSSLSAMTALTTTSLARIIASKRDSIARIGGWCSAKDAFARTKTDDAALHQLRALQIGITMVVLISRASADV